MSGTSSSAESLRRAASAGALIGMTYEPAMETGAMAGGRGAMTARLGPWAGPGPQTPRAAPGLRTGGPAARTPGVGLARGLVQHGERGFQGMGQVARLCACTAHHLGVAV